MSYRVLDAEDSSNQARHEAWGSLTWLASESLTESTITVGRVTIKKGMNNPRHAHPNCEEVLYLIRGQLCHSVGDEMVTLNPGDTLVIDKGVFHHAVSTGEEDADMIVSYSTGARDFVKEIPSRGNQDATNIAMLQAK